MENLQLGSTTVYDLATDLTRQQYESNLINKHHCMLMIDTNAKTFLQIDFENAYFNMLFRILSVHFLLHVCIEAIPQIIYQQ